MTYDIIKIKEAIDFIENNLNKKLYLEIVANSVGYSKYHLHRMFSKTVGLSIHDYIQRRKFTEVAKLLLFSEKSILEIALLAGYESQQAFTTAFKHMYKKTPNSFRESETFYPLQLRYNFHEKEWNSMSLEEMKQQITFAKLEDVSSLIAFAHLTIDGFPNLDEAMFLQAMKQCIEEKRVLLIKQHQVILALMAFHYETGSIDFFGIHPFYRKRGVAKIFLDTLMNDILHDKEISITTFREGDKADTGYRKAYKELGFAEAELLIEFNYPTQRMILSKQNQGDHDE